MQTKTVHELTIELVIQQHAILELRDGSLDLVMRVELFGEAYQNQLGTGSSAEAASQILG